MNRRKNSDIPFAPLKSRPISGRKSACVGLIGFAIALTGCVVTAPASIVSTQGASPAGASIRLAPFADDGSLRALFGAALGETLASSALASPASASPALANSASASSAVGDASSPQTIAEFAIAARAAGSGIADPDTSTAEAISWQSLPRQSRWYDECEGIRLRATLLLLNTPDGSIAYRGIAEADVCEYNQADLRALADVLVEDASRR